MRLSCCYVHANQHDQFESSKCSRVPLSGPSHSPVSARTDSLDHDVIGVSVRDHDRKREYVGGLTQPADTTDSGSGGVSPSDRWRPPAVSVATHSLTNIGKTVAT